MKYKDGMKLRILTRGNLTLEKFDEALAMESLTIEVSKCGAITFKGVAFNDCLGGTFSEGYLDEHFEILSVLTKDDLKTGMVLEFDDGSRFMLVKDSMYGNYLIDERDGNYFFCLDNYKKDLSMKSKNLNFGNESDYFADIYRVWSNVNISEGFTYSHDEMIEKADNLLWENPKHKPREMTVTEIEGILGYVIKIKKETKC